MTHREKISKGFSFFSNLGSDSKGLPLKTKTEMQSKLIRSILKNDITFASGSAGTGKTFVAIACAAKLLQEKEINKIVLLRPPVETGKSIGFLPGDMSEKFAPYLLPFYDSFLKILGNDKFQKYLEEGKIEMSPLTFIRGSTQNSFTILDEAQNCTKAEMEMFITRLGQDGKFVITGDGSQTDIKGAASGFDHAIHILEHIDGVGVVEFTEDDIVRHRIVKEAILAYRNDRAIPYNRKGVETNGGYYSNLESNILSSTNEL